MLNFMQLLGGDNREEKPADHMPHTHIGSLCSLSRAAGADQTYNQANKLFSKGNYTEAISLYQALLSSPSNGVSSVALYTRIADSYFRLGDYKNALDAYRSALKGPKAARTPADPVLDRVLHLSPGERRGGGE